MQSIGIAAPINWGEPNSQFEGSYLSKVRHIAAHNRDMTFYVIDLYSLSKSGQITAYDIKRDQCCRVGICTFSLIHFLELERYLDSKQTFHDKWAEVSAILDVLEQFNVHCINTIAAVRYSMSKMYLFNLEAAGIPIIPTQLILATTSLECLQVKNAYGQYIIKPLRGECGRHVLELSKTDNSSYRDLQQQDDHFLLQPLQPEVRSGEIGLLFYGNQLAHAVIRRPCIDDTGRLNFPLKLNAEYYRPTKNEISFGLDVYKTFKESLHIYRVDFIHTANGPLLMEVEAVDPFHYAHLSPSYAVKIGDYYREQLLTEVTV